LAVEFDVGELGVLQCSCVRSREAVSAFIFIGTSGAMVGVWSSFILPVRFLLAFTHDVEKKGCKYRK